MNTTKQDLIGAVAWAGAMIGLAFAANYANKLGYIDHDTARRLCSGVIGLWMAWYGNRMPKKVVPSACARQATRVAGWSLALSGLVYAGLWAFAPIPVAMTAGTGVVLTGMAVTLGYCLTLWANAKAA